MALLYLSMLANAMWYGTIPDTPGGAAFKLGPFALSPEQVSINDILTQCSKMFADG
jgi:hypothetical protein